MQNDLLEIRTSGKMLDPKLPCGLYYPPVNIAHARHHDLSAYRAYFQ